MFRIVCVWKFVGSILKSFEYYNFLCRRTNVIYAILSPTLKFLFSLSMLQTNVYANAQHRKMSYFEGYKKKAIVVIPPHHELRKRIARRNEEMGSPVPEEAINAMKGVCRCKRVCCVWVCVQVFMRGCVCVCVCDFNFFVKYYVPVHCATVQFI